jgi:hypothetical protein
MFLTLTGAASLAVWLYPLARGGFGGYLGCCPDRSAFLPRDGPVPARNEAVVVARSVTSLAAQQYPGEFHLVPGRR